VDSSLAACYPACIRTPEAALLRQRSSFPARNAVVWPASLHRIRRSQRASACARRTFRSSSTRAAAGGATSRRSASMSPPARTRRCWRPSRWSLPWCAPHVQCFVGALMRAPMPACRALCIWQSGVHDVCCPSSRLLRLQQPRPCTAARGSWNPTWVLALPQDVFSMGCVLAELFLDGKELFNLSQVISPSGRPCACARPPCLHSKGLHRACVPRTHIAPLQEKSSRCCCGS